MSMSVEVWLHTWSCAATSGRVLPEPVMFFRYRTTYAQLIRNSPYTFGTETSIADQDQSMTEYHLARAGSQEPKV